MGKFMIACPKCGGWHNASKGLFARRVIACNCGNRFSVKDESLTVCTCQNCGNRVMLDRTRGAKARCPICDAQLFNPAELTRYIDIHCKNCGTPMHVLKGSGTAVCPVCDTENDVAQAEYLQQAGADKKPVVIKGGGEADLVVWKHPIRDFVSGSELQVHEGQQAVFFRNGEMMDAFGPGVHKLTTDILAKLSKAEPGAMEQKPFSAEVYFINTTPFKDIPWGTASKLSLFDPESRVNVELGASGMLSVRVADPRALIQRMVGARDTLSISDLFGAGVALGSYRAMVVTKVKSYLATFIRDNRVNVLEVDAYIDPLSNALRGYINQDSEMRACGLELTDFKLMTILLPAREENPTFWELRDLYGRKTIAEKQAEIARIQATVKRDEIILEGQGEAEVMRMQSPYIEKFEKRGFKPAGDGEEKPGGAFCPECGKAVPEGSRFCNHCGARLTAVKKMFCSQCGQELAPGSAFCSQCGTRQPGM